MLGLNWPRAQGRIPIGYMNRQRISTIGSETLFADPFGADNLRYAMVVTLTISLLGAFFLWMGARGLKRDLELNQQALSAAAEG